MSIFKKMLLIPSSVVALPLIATTLTSCSTVDALDENLATQLESLTSPEAKEIYSNNWSRDAYAELYLISKSSTTDVNSEIFKENKATIKSYLKTLEPIPATTTINGITGDKISAEIYSHLFSAYTFYTAWKTSNDINYFRNQKQVWVEKQLSLGDKTIEMNFQPKFAYSSSTTTEIEFKKDFDLLYKIIQTGIQTELLNMAIAEFYFTAATSDMIQIGTNYNEIIDGNINSLNYWEATSFDINSPTYFLEKYLVEKAPKIKWNYSSEEASKIENWTHKKIKDPKNYFDLWAGEQVGTTSSPKKIFSEDLLVKSNDVLFNANALDFYGYNSSIELSSTSGEGDLSTDADVIRRFGQQTSGLFNFETKKLVSYDALAKRQKIEALNASAYLPKISIANNTNTIRKNSKQIIAEDLIIGENDSQFDAFNTYSDKTENTWKLLEITPILGTTNQQSIELKMSYNNSNAINGFQDYLYNVIITWNQTNNPSESNIVSELPRKMLFNNIDANTPFGKQQLYGVNPIVNGKVNVSYYIRLLPNFKWKSVDGIKEVKEIDGKEKAIGTFTMVGTPWDKITGTNNQRQLAFSLYMNDAELIKNIKSYLVLNDIAIRPGKIKEVNDVLKELGILYLDKKPSYAKPKISDQIK